MEKTASSKFSSPWWSKAGVVYFIGAGQPTAAVKIGVTQEATIVQRLRAIQCDNHEPLELLGIIVFGSGEKPMRLAEQREQDLHKLFARHQRVLDGNVGHEWFNFAPEIRKYVEENAVEPEGLGLPRRVAKVAANGLAAIVA